MACAAVVLDRPAAGATQLPFYLAAGWCLLPAREDASITLHDFKVHAAAMYFNTVHVVITTNHYHRRGRLVQQKEHYNSELIGRSAGFTTPIMLTPLGA